MRVIVTGGAGFIGSCFVRKLNDEGITDIIIVDEPEAVHAPNLSGKTIAGFMQKDELLARIQKETIGPADLLVHMGACSSTTETDRDYLVRNNYLYSQELCRWALANKVRFLYASSGATYGDGSLGFSDDDAVSLRLKPLNLYGLSKWLFDAWVIREGLTGTIAGFKFFNVFGPNEYHKGDMRSVVLKSFEKITATGEISLFRSHRPDYRDGEQKRDFVYVRDVVEAVWFFALHPEKNGVFNIGTGKARTFNDLVTAVFAALDLPPNITYFDMPDAVRNQYQYFTEADITKLRTAGFTQPFRELENSVKEYVGYLRETTCL